MPISSLRILLTGMIAGDPYQGGATWAVLQYLLGLRALGHDVCFVEPIAPTALNPPGSELRSSKNVRYFDEVLDRYRCGGRAALLLAGTRNAVGMEYGALVEFARSADVLINISGLLTDAALIDRIPVRIYLDIDPAFNQLWHAVQGIDRNFAGHTHFVTIGESIGTSDCDIPDCGLQWIPMRQPIVLREWPFARVSATHGVTTVGNWRAYGSVEYSGVFYGQKAHSMRPLFPLAKRTDEPFLLAMAIHGDERGDLDALALSGWRLCDPAIVAATPWDYHAFVQHSKAEFGIAKSGYVHSGCGWFSDRSVCYLASGRPVLAQQTGFSRTLPIGEGLFSFETIDDVLMALDALNAQYDRHRGAARELAQAYFDSDRVLRGLLDRTIGAT